MTALCRYQLADLLRSQRWVPPLFGYAVALAFVYGADAGPAIPAFAVTAAVLLPVAAWLTRTVLSTEDPVARQVTAATAGGQLRVQGALLLSSLSGTVPLALLAVAWAALLNPAEYGAATVAGGVGVHLVFAAVGVGLGALAGVPLVRRPGVSLLGIVAGTLLAVLVPVSPVRWTLDVLVTDQAGGFTAALAGPLAVLLAVATAAGLVSLAAARRC